MDATVSSTLHSLNNSHPNWLDSAGPGSATKEETDVLLPINGHAFPPSLYEEHNYEEHNYEGYTRPLAPPKSITYLIQENVNTYLPGNPVSLKMLGHKIRCLVSIFLSPVAILFDFVYGSIAYTFSFVYSTKGTSIDDTAKFTVNIRYLLNLPFISLSRILNSKQNPIEHYGTSHPICTNILKFMCDHACYSKPIKYNAFTRQVIARIVRLVELPLLQIVQLVDLALGIVFTPFALSITFLGISDRFISRFNETTYEQLLIIPIPLLLYSMHALWDPYLGYPPRPQDSSSPLRWRIIIYT